MNWFDVLLLLILLIFTGAGITRGFIKQIFSVAALMGGIIVGLIFYDIAGAMIVERNYIDNESIANVAGFLILFFLGYVVIQTLGWATSKLIGVLKLSWINRLAGGGLGFIFGVTTVFMISTAIIFLMPGENFVTKNSTLVPYLETAYDVVIDSLPEDFEQSLQNTRELIREKGLQAAMQISESGTATDIKKDIGDNKKDEEIKKDKK